MFLHCVAFVPLATRASQISPDRQHKRMVCHSHMPLICHSYATLKQSSAQCRDTRREHALPMARHHHHPAQHTYRGTVRPMHRPGQAPHPCTSPARGDTPSCCTRKHAKSTTGRKRGPGPKGEERSNKTHRAPFLPAARWRIFALLLLLCIAKPQLEPLRDFLFVKLSMNDLQRVAGRLARTS